MLCSVATGGNEAGVENSLVEGATGGGDYFEGGRLKVAGGHDGSWLSYSF